MNKTAVIIAKKIDISLLQATAAINLLDEGATVPFIARYRKEATQGLDDTQLRLLSRELNYTRELADRKTTILAALTENQKLTSSLQQSIEQCQSKTALEEIYKPFKSSRKTKGQLAIEAGLAPLAKQLLSSSNQSPQDLANAFVTSQSNINDPEQALDGAAAIISEELPQDIVMMNKIRRQLWSQGIISAKQARKKTPAIDPNILSKFKDYFAHQEPINKIPSHRMMALLRGKAAGALQINLALNFEPKIHPCLELINQSLKLSQRNVKISVWLGDVAQQCWKLKILPSVTNELINKAKESAEIQAIDVFANNLSDLLMAAPAGNQITLGLDPGIRTGVKAAIVDKQSKLLATDTIYPHAPRNQWQQSISTLATLIKRHHITLISIGNGTGSRETEKLVLDCKKQHQFDITTIIVSEAGASVYSASELAANEFPSLDVSLRGAVSIARRLQDPLAELVKIEPKAIGVGQYQHDVNENQLNARLNEVVEDCVNGVGVELNTASVPLLQRVSGLNATLANNIVHFRESIGKFKNRKQLLKVPRLGPKAYEQAAGFLRISNGNEPLDASAVHPESYHLASNIVKRCGKNIKELIGNDSLLNNLKATEFTTANIGLPTVIDVINELKRPARDPRGDFKAAKLMEGIETINDLELEMTLEGTVTNVANFGAFVDIGVHQDGLVHISQLADGFVSDPRKVVKVGQVVNVRVTDIDVARKRIALSMKQQSASTTKHQYTENKKKLTPQGTMAAAFNTARKN
ncbi:MAG: Tex family protein [Psychrobium sp.]